MNLRARHILVGISGGIAAYKILSLIRYLTKAGAEVRVTTSKNAFAFVTELTLRTLSGNPVYSDVFAAVNAHATEHISLPVWADLMVIAPASADVVCKLAFGIADDALTTTAAAMRKPLVIAPAMNNQMYASPATQQAMEQLRTREGVTLLDCAEGDLACGTTGKGRMQEIEGIIDAIKAAFTPKTMIGKRVLITAGSTIEKIDPVRYISNFSTGKMGRALADECRHRGAEVSLIAGELSAQAMYEQTLQAFPHHDMAILCAAVSDFTPACPSPEKIKKKPGQKEWSLSLKTTPDIAAALGKIKQPTQTLIGFALETENEEVNALSKMKSKNLDYIVLNSLRHAGAGFGTETNRVTVFSRNGQKKDIPLMLKEDVAQQILDFI